MTTTLDPVVVAREEQEEVQRRPPTYTEIVDRIVVEAAAAGFKIGPPQAVAFLIFVDEAVMAIRAQAHRSEVSVGRISYHIHVLDLERFHALMTVIMPDEAVATPGSAHDMINCFLLSRNEIGIRHTSSGEEFVYCDFVLDIETTGS